LLIRRHQNLLICAW